MFEDQSQQSAVEELKQRNPEFKELLERHQYLDKKLRRSDQGINGIDDITAHEMKREKLAAKEKLLEIFETA